MSIYMDDTTHLHMWHDSFIYVTWLILVHDITCSHVWRVSMCATWLTCVRHDSHVCDMTHMCVWYDSHVCDMTQMCVAWLNICDMTQSFMWRDSIICVTWLNHLCHMTQSYVRHDSVYVWHDSIIFVTLLNHLCDITQSFVCHDSFIHVQSHPFICVPWLIHTCEHDLFIRVTGQETYRSGADGGKILFSDF